MNFLTLPAITGALASTPGGITRFNAKVIALSLQANFVYGSGGTTVDAYVQSSIDNAVTWFDVANFHFTTSSVKSQFNLSGQTPQTSIKTPTNGSITANTCLDGIWGNLFRVLYASTGTYAGTTSLSIDAACDLA